MMQVCEVIYGCERGAALAVFVEATTGQPCPCKRDLPCLLMPRTEAGDEPVTVPAVVPAVAAIPVPR